MTQRLYLHSDDLKMNVDVVACSPAADDTFHVVLSATLFHPQGGGQPSDVGTMGQANVIQVTQVGEDVIHTCDREVSLGNTRIEVSSHHRMLHARLHSAGHLIGYCCERLGWKAVKAHHWPGEARVVFERDNGIELATPDIIEQLANEQVAADLPRYIHQEGLVRKVGYGQQPAYPCGGTHVSSSQVVGRITVSKVKEKKGQISVHYSIEDQ